MSRCKLLAIQPTLCEVYDIITLSETNLHAGVGDDFKLKWVHDFVRQDRDGHWGGVVLYIRDNIVFKMLNEFERPDLEAVCLSIQTTEGNILLCTCYRPRIN